MTKKPKKRGTKRPKKHGSLSTMVICVAVNERVATLRDIQNMLARVSMAKDAQLRAELQIARQAVEQMIEQSHKLMP